jgi:acyl carrier protein
VLEILFLAEEALGMSIENEEIRTVHTVGDIKRMVIAKSRGRAPQPGLAAVAAT